MSSLTADLEVQNASLEERNKAVEDHLSHRTKLEQDLDEAKGAAEQHKQAHEETQSKYLESSDKVSNCRTLTVYILTPLRLKVH